MPIVDSCDNDLAISVLAQESLQVLVGDPQDTVEPVRYQLSRLDPAPNRPRRDPQRFRDVGNGEKSHMSFAIAPRANGGVSEVGRLDRSATSHVGDPRSLRPLPPHPPAASFHSPARSSMRSSAATGTLIRRPIIDCAIPPKSRTRLTASQRARRSPISLRA